jgi:hypothetical protein
MFGRLKTVTLVLVLVSLSSIIFTHSFANATVIPVLEWSNTYSPTSGVSIAQTSDNGYIIAGIYRHGWHDGMTFTTTVIKTSASGGVEWTKQFGDEYTGPIFTVSITKTSDSGYILSTPISQLIKMDSQGNTQWTAKVNCGEILEVNDGYVVAGNTLGSRIFSNITKVDFNGNIQWVKSFETGNDKDIAFWALALTKDNNYAIAGCWANYQWFGIVDANGNFLVNKTYSKGSVYVFSGIIAISDGGFVLCGEDSHGSPTLYKVDNQGNLIWEKAFPSLYTLKSVVETQDNGFVVTGSIYVPQNSSFVSDTAGALIKTDSNGFQEWMTNYTTANSVGKIVTTSDGGFAVIGSQNGNIWLAKFNFTDAPAETPVSPSPSIPELSWLVLLPLIISTFSAAVALRYRKTVNVKQ